MKPCMYLDIYQVSFLHPILQLVLADIYGQWGPQLITSLWRKDGRIHETIPLRAVDLGAIPDLQGPRLEVWINARWVYNSTGSPGRRVALWHNVGQGLHLHVQVHEHTYKMGDMPLHT